MNLPPSTGIPELDTYLYNLYLNIVDSSNSQGYSSDPNTGIITDSDGNLVGYLYQYLHIKYAIDNTGTGMSDTPTGQYYYGLNNSTSSTESTNPADYTWYLVNYGIGFGTTLFLYYQILGGRRIKWDVNTAPIDYRWLLAPSLALDLDILVPPQTISSSELLDAAVTELKIAASAVSASKLNVAAISNVTGNLVTNSVGPTQIQLAAVTAGKLSVAAIESATGNLVANSVGTTQISDNAITSAKVTANAIVAGKIAANAVTATEIAANSITADKITTNAVTADKILANAVTSEKITANAITASKIDANAVTAVKIEAGAVTSDKIFAGAVTSDKITVGTLSAINANMGTITAGDLSIGSSPTISGTTMTGTGSHLYSNGNFAFGNSTTNMVFNGTNVFLNGFVSGSNSQFVFQIIKSYFDKLYNFNVSKPTYIVYGTSGDTYFIINDTNVVSFGMQYQFGLMPVTGAVEMVAGTNYQISVVGTTNFTAYGAASNTVGTFFTATSAGTGTGQVYDYSTLLMAVNRDWRTPCSLSNGYRNASMSTSFTDTRYLSPRTYGYDIVLRYISLSYINSSGTFISPAPGYLENLNLQGAINFSYAANI